MAGFAVGEGRKGQVQGARNCVGNAPTYPTEGEERFPPVARIQAEN